MPTGQSPENAVIRPLRAGDLPAVCDLFEQVFGTARTPAQWSWKYRLETPLFSTPVGMVAEDDTGRILGHAGAVPLHGWLDGASCRMYQIADVMVHPRARGHHARSNLFTRLVRSLLEALADPPEPVFAYGFPGRRPFLLGARARVYDRIEDARTFHRVPRPALLRMGRLLPATWEDPQFDSAWRRLRRHVPLGVARDRNYLVWRYRDNPFFVYQPWWLVLGGRRRGWMVTRAGAGTLTLMDALFHPFWWKRALAALDAEALAMGMDQIEAWWPRTLPLPGNAQVTKTDIVVTHMVWKTFLTTARVRRTLYYTFGDVDIY